ncbi:hypothetical protein [Variovorax sp. KBS0712]|uniref:hypothetical protein n=1 Tax=Variovorax sp. KBS0712 TaxID=2578111 RepID=UPI00163D82C0|nr:hypothetical protein [Variovorax sp. KBS0712]
MNVLWAVPVAVLVIVFWRIALLGAGVFLVACCLAGMVQILKALNQLVQDFDCGF